MANKIFFFTTKAPTSMASFGSRNHCKKGPENEKESCYKPDYLSVLLLKSMPVLTTGFRLHVSLHYI